MKKLFAINNIRIYLLVFILFLVIHLTYFIVFPQEVFAMEPEAVLKSFNPDTYIRHELDGKPIYKLDVSNYYSHPRYYDPIQDHYELHEDSLDTKSLEGKLKKDLYNTQCLVERTKHNMYVEAKVKQRSCGRERPVYHKPVLDLPKTSSSDLSKTSSYDTTKYPAKSLFSRISKFVDNKPSGVMDHRNIEEVQEMRRRRYYSEFKRHNEYVKRSNSELKRYNEYVKRSK